MIGPIKRSKSNIPSKSFGSNLLSFLFHPGPFLTFPPYLQITLNQRKCGIEALTGEESPLFCIHAANMDFVLLQPLSKAIWVNVSRSKCTHRFVKVKITSAINGRAITQYQVNARYLRQEK